MSEFARLRLALKTIAEWEVTDSKNMDAMNMKHLAQTAIAAGTSVEELLGLGDRIIAAGLKAVQGDDTALRAVHAELREDAIRRELALYEKTVVDAMSG